ncbi:MAG: hypothetical protein CYG61_03715 [Actinobacteria bacterium]|nr:MAG: hypothetical protein CYG61_03715 [Actinomycetota bacterium]
MTPESSLGNELHLARVESQPEVVRAAGAREPDQRRRWRRQPQDASHAIATLAGLAVLLGIGVLLARERVQVLPLVLVLLALPAARRHRPAPPRFGPPPLHAARRSNHVLRL